MIQGSNKVSSKEETIVSLYLEKPFLINRKKFDMRMYVLVTSFHPLRVYFYQEGLARFATEEYSNDPKILKNKFVHLTNFSINKKNLKSYVRNDNRAGSKGRPGIVEDEQMIDEDPEQESSSKWSLRFLKKYLKKKMIEDGRVFKKDEDIFASCYDIIIKTLIASEVQIVKEMNKVGNR